MIKSEGAYRPAFKVKHHSGRILGPLDLERIKKLVLKNQITGVELAKEYPNGLWLDINRIPELAELLFRHASGNLGGTEGGLKSDQSSYRPILSPTREQFAPTVVLPAGIPEKMVKTQRAVRERKENLEPDYAPPTEELEATWVEPREQSEEETRPPCAPLKWKPTPTLPKSKRS